MTMDVQEDFCVLLDDSLCDGNEYDNYTPTTPIPKKRKRPSVLAPWTYDEINCLISCIEEHPCVWQYSCSDYKDRHKREQAWSKIQEICFGHTIDDCKGKWANLKTEFQNVKKKMKTKSGQGTDNTKPHWPHWSAMQFYNRHDLAKSTGSISTIDVEDAEDAQPEKVEQVSILKLKKVASSGEDKQDELMRRAVNYLETEEDNWHTIGMYLASQMRELAKTHKKAANKLHMQLVKTAMEAFLEADE